MSRRMAGNILSLMSLLFTCLRLLFGDAYHASAPSSASASKMDPNQSNRCSCHLPIRLLRWNQPTNVLQCILSTSQGGITVIIFKTTNHAAFQLCTAKIYTMWSKGFVIRCNATRRYRTLCYCHSGVTELISDLVLTAVHWSHCSALEKQKKMVSPGACGVLARPGPSVQLWPRVPAATMPRK